MSRKQITSISWPGMLDWFLLIIFHLCCLYVEKGGYYMALILTSRTRGQENQQFDVSLGYWRKTTSSVPPPHKE